MFPSPRDTVLGSLPIFPCGPGPLACLCLALLVAPMQTEARCFLLCGIHVTVTVANFVTNSIPKIQHNYFYNVVFEVKNSNERLIAIFRSVDKMVLDRCVPRSCMRPPIMLRTCVPLLGPGFGCWQIWVDVVFAFISTLIEALAAFSAQGPKS